MQERRKSLIANEAFQLRWIVQIILASFILINTVLIVAFLASGAGLNTPGDRLILGGAVAVTEVFGLVLVFRIARRHSNRIAGPVYRVQVVAEALSRGDLTESARIRDGDFFAEELESLGNALETLQTRIRDIQKTAAEIENAHPGDEGVARLREQANWFKTGEQPGK